MYQFKETLNYSVFYKFDKMNVRNKKWARLPQASKSIYPVIAVHCDKEGVAFPGQLTIAILSGRTPKTVRDGISGLIGYPGFKVNKKITNTGHRAKKYKIDPAPNDRGRSFRFYKCFVYGGNWSQLTPSAQALYPVIQTFSLFDFEEYAFYEEEECEDLCHTEYFKDGHFKQRKYDFVNAEKDILAEYAGIGISTTYAALESLEEEFLIEKIDPINGHDT